MLTQEKVYVYFHFLTAIANQSTALGSISKHAMPQKLLESREQCLNTWSYLLMLLNVQQQDTARSYNKYSIYIK